MIVPILLATALSVPTRHLPAHQAGQPMVVSREAPREAEGASPLNLFAYCDAKRQSWIMVTNAGPTPLVVQWTLTAIVPGYPQDRWSGTGRVDPGKFEGWMSPAPFLHLDIRYDEDGLPATSSIDASCSATAAEGGGFGTAAEGSGFGE